MNKSERAEVTKKLHANFSRARTYVRLNGPYFMDVVMKFVIAPCWDAESMHKKIRLSEDFLLYFDPVYVANMPYEELGTTMVMYAHHVLMRHSARAKRVVTSDNPQLEWCAAQYAMSLAVCWMMLDAGWQFPTHKVPAIDQEGYMYKKKVESVLIPEVFGWKRGMTFEEYQLMLADMFRENEARYREMKDNAMHTAGDDGGVTGMPYDVDRSLLDMLRKDFEPIDPNEVEDAAKEALQKLIDNDTRGGYGSHRWDSYLKGFVKKSVMRWEQILHGTITNAVGQVSAGAQDYSWKYPSRRSHVIGLLLPGLIKHDPNILFALDVSGSMSDHYTLRMLSELASILRQLNVDAVDVLQLDDRVLGAPKRTSINDLQGVFNRMGCGGTDFDDLIKYVNEKMQPKPDLVIIATDGGGDITVNKVPAGMNLVWAIIGEISNDHFYMQKFKRTGRVIRVLDPDTGEVDKFGGY